MFPNELFFYTGWLMSTFHKLSVPF